MENDEFSNKPKNNTINIIINKNVFNFSGKNIEKRYIKNLLIYDFINPKSNKIDFFRNSTNDKINEKYERK